MFSLKQRAEQPPSGANRISVTSGSLQPSAASRTAAASESASAVVNIASQPAVGAPTPQIIYVTPEPTQVPPPTSAPVETPVKQESRKMDSNTVLLLLLLIMLAVGGFVAWFITSQRKRQTPRIPEYDEDEEIEDSEEDPADSE